jgi:cytidine deaminase
VSDAIDWPSLEAAARAVRVRAYAPYSRYAVGAALLSVDGTVFTGVNVENASYGLTVCAERGAISAAIAAGQHRFAALVVAVKGARAAAPCGVCRQVLAEFPPSFPIVCVSADGDRFETSVAELLPHAFGPSYLEDDT